MLTKAGDAVEAAFQLWNNARHWNFLKNSAQILTQAPYEVASCDTTANSTTVTAPSLSSVSAGDIVSGTGIRGGTFVVSVNLAAVPDSMVLSSVASDTGTVTLTFYRRDYDIPTNFKYIYSMRNLSTSRILRPMDSRLYDRIEPDQLPTDEPLVYDLHPQGEDGKVRLLPTPNGTYLIEAKYYRRLTVPSAEGTALDIPIDFEWGIMAEAKAIFLAEKGGYDALAAFWAAKAATALREAIKADMKHPDEQHGFLPGYLSGVSVRSGGVGGDSAGDGWGFDYGGEWGD